MKIKYAVMGSDMNPLYYEFWPIISKVWKEVFNIIPVLGLICDEDSELIEDNYGLVKKFKSIDGIDYGFQSQIVRFYLPTILDGICITSDIDMMPLSKDYFIKNIENFDDSNFYVMTSDNPECLQNKEYQMCYNIAKPKMFKHVLNINDSWVEFVNKLKNLGFGWTTDQRYLYDMVNSYSNKEKIVLLNRGFTGLANNRIDRAIWRYDPNLVIKGHYIDSHLVRPYNQYKSEVDALAKLLYLNN
jgi:hypothetical protein